MEESWDWVILFVFSFVSPKSSFDLSIKAAILFGSISSFFSNSDFSLMVSTPAFFQTSFADSTISCSFC